MIIDIYYLNANGSFSPGEEIFNNSREEPSPASPPWLLHHLMPSMEPSPCSLGLLWELCHTQLSSPGPCCPSHPSTMLCWCQRPLRTHSIRIQQGDSFKVSPKWNRQSSVPLPSPCGDNSLCTAGVHVCSFDVSFRTALYPCPSDLKLPFYAGKDPAQHITKCISDLEIIIRCPDTGSWSTEDLVHLKTITTLLGLSVQQHLRWLKQEEFLKTNLLSTIPLCLHFSFLSAWGMRLSTRLMFISAWLFDCHFTALSAGPAGGTCFPLKK